MNKRDTFLEQSYWEKHIPFLEGAIDEYEAVAARSTTTAEHRMMLRYSIFSTQLELLVARYSGGEPIGTLRHMFPHVIDALAAYQGQPGIETVDFEPVYEYVEALWLVSFAILLDASQEDLVRLLSLLDNEGQDALYERLVALRIEGRKMTTTLLHPRPYEWLYKALDARGQERDQLIALFLTRYYRGMRHTPWYGRHLSTNRGFFGYWCFELAAFVKGLGLPDESFATNVYYPRDLIRAS